MRVTSAEAKRLARQAGVAIDREPKARLPQEDKANDLDALLRVHAPDLHAEMVREYKIVPERKFRADFAHPGSRVLIEVDGGQWAARGGRHNQDSDREKLNLAAVGGWRVLRFSSEMLASDPFGVIETIRAAVAQV